MRVAQRAKRDHMAQGRLVAAAEKLAKELALPAELVKAVQVQRGEPEVRAMLQREALADLLEAVVGQVVPKVMMPPAAKEAKKLTAKGPGYAKKQPAKKPGAPPGASGPGTPPKAAK